MNVDQTQHMTGKSFNIERERLSYGNFVYSVTTCEDASCSMCIDCVDEAHAQRLWTALEAATDMCIDGHDVLTRKARR